MTLNGIIAHAIHSLPPPPLTRALPSFSPLSRRRGQVIRRNRGGRRRGGQRPAHRRAPRGNHGSPQQTQGVHPTRSRLWRRRHDRRGEARARPAAPPRTTDAAVFRQRRAQGLGGRIRAPFDADARPGRRLWIPVEGGGRRRRGVVQDAGGEGRGDDGAAVVRASGVDAQDGRQTL